jgi:hypothetical protein
MYSGFFYNPKPCLSGIDRLCGNFRLDYSSLHLCHDSFLFSTSRHRLSNLRIYASYIWLEILLHLITLISKLIANFT